MTLFLWLFFQIEEIVKRLPAMTVDPSSGIKEFSMRERSIPPPRTGNTIEIKAAKVPKFRAGKALKDALN